MGFWLECFLERGDKPYSNFEFITDWTSKCTGFGLPSAFNRDTRAMMTGPGGPKRGFALLVGLELKKLQRHYKGYAATELPFAGDVACFGPVLIRSRRPRG